MFAKTRTVLALTAGAVALTLTPVQADAPNPAPYPKAHGKFAEAISSPCADESDVDCYWNAKWMGNGRGHSYYAVSVGKTVCVFYWSPKFAARHDYCA